jgi:predicted Zn-dependent protease
MTEGERPIRVRRGKPASQAIALLTALAIASASMPTRAQAAGLPLIRDAEIEQLLREYTQPILKAADLERQNIQVVIINDRSFNAFVADGRRIFVNAGALLDAKTPNEIIGVLAHETGHIAGGHLSRLRQQLATAQTQMIIAVLLGLGAAVAASSAGASGNPAAAILGPQTAIQRSLLSYQRAQEEQADRAGVKLLTATHQSSKGMYDTFKRLGDQVLFAAHGADPYLQSHPMPAQRVAALEVVARSNPYWSRTDPPQLQLRHDLMRAKLAGFLDRAGSVARRYPFSDNSLPARYARAIATYRHGALASAIGQIDGLIQSQPNNPYFYELKGQALLEGRKPREAIPPLRRAIQLAPQPILIKAMLAQALMATNDPKAPDEVISLLSATAARERVLQPEFRQMPPIGYRQLAVAYGRKGDIARAQLTSAEEALMAGDIRTARDRAAHAKARFKIGSPGWKNADDIVRISPPKTSLGGP